MLEKRLALNFYYIYDHNSHSHSGMGEMYTLTLVKEMCVWMPEKY